MKKIAVILFLVMVTPLLVGAEETVERPSFTVTGYTKILSQYLAGNGSVLYDRPVSQSGLTLGWGDGYSVDFWGSYPLNGKDGFGKKFDLTLCKDTNLSETWLLSACLAWYHLTPKRFGDLISPQIKIARKFVLSESHRLTASFKVEGYIPTEKLPTWGVLPEFKLVHSWDISNFLTLNHGPMFVPDHGASGNDPTIVGGYDTELSWRLNKHISFQLPMVKFRSPMTKVSDGRRPTTAFGTGIVLNW